MLVKTTVGHVLRVQKKLSLSPAIPEKRNKIPVFQTPHADNLSHKLLHTFITVVGNSLHCYFSPLRKFSSIDFTKTYFMFIEFFGL
ncbi:hypothetical protein IGI04_013828 [Brassica rapa subsp. trilocularis]|uniref:Uncharacterized protein n=1 Tax=Brassica rapa subsp. trilocularis TaxID=1813537 RepID=A0ABQ7N9Z2_BRACM|nr:hypothetical protein IGI04_013828 [Brassica rapa subsp. trilocularis]